MVERGSPKEYEEKLAIVLDRLRSINPGEAKARLDAEQKERHRVDPQAGIIIVHLPDEPVNTEDGLEYRFHLARILPAQSGQQNFVTPHLHKIGGEPYRYLGGSDGEMNTGRVEGDRVEWNDPEHAVPGAEVMVKEGEVHSLRNKGGDYYDFAFACPNAHLEDNDPVARPTGDRYIVKDMPGGIPPWYSKP